MNHLPKSMEIREELQKELKKFLKEKKAENESLMNLIRALSKNSGKDLPAELKTISKK